VLCWGGGGGLRRVCARACVRVRVQACRAAAAVALRSGRHEPPGRCGVVVERLSCPALSAVNTHPLAAQPNVRTFDLIAALPSSCVLGGAGGALRGRAPPPPAREALFAAAGFVGRGLARAWGSGAALIALLFYAKSTND
jgi:hypothetical protein